MAYRVTGKAVYRDEALRIFTLAGPFETAFERARRHWLETGKTNWTPLLQRLRVRRDPAAVPELVWRGPRYLLARGPWASWISCCGMICFIVTS